MEISMNLEPCPVYNRREKSVSPMQMIDLKSTDPVQKFILKAQTALATGHFSNQLDYGVL